ncbi:MAG: hypothetical protein HY303_20470 [Candidatus Wallbacteria bacterium]|nr:hypothetical protein [Candidatus Wallbacteria bacterium]
MPPARSHARRILLVCYDPKELDTLLTRVRVTGTREVPRSRFPLHEGTLDGRPVELMRIPFGDDIGLLQTVVRELLSATLPKQIVGVGTAMAAVAELEIGDVVVSRAAHRQGRTVEFGAWLNEELLRAAPHGMRARPGQSVTTRAFVSSAAERDALLAGYPRAAIVEMEDFHVASLAAEFGADFASVRAITDRGDFVDHMARRTQAACAVVRLVRRGLRQLRMSRALTVVDNPPTRDLGYRILLSTPSERLSLPDAIRFSRKLLSLFDFSSAALDGARLDLTLSPVPPKPDAEPRTPSGQAKTASRPGIWTLLHDPVTHYTDLRVSASAFHSGALEPLSLRALLRETETCLVGKSTREERHFSLPAVSSFHIQGLNSISAEPEEGLLAATTISEFRDNGLEVADSHAAACWIYRSANASAESYFHPPYSVPARTHPEVPSGTLLIATGLGPAVDPAAGGGSQAHMLVLGDEQGGRLVQILDDLLDGPFCASDVLRYDGVAARLDDSTAALTRLDRRRILTDLGMNSLRYDPGVLRGIYSAEYDRFLSEYFSSSRGPKPPKSSHLLMTSRGCGYHCSFCCSGGMQPFAALDIGLLIGLLREILEVDAPAAGEHIDVYLLDSYFNRNPERVIQLAERLEKEGLLGNFEFFVRHNGLQAFLRRRAEDGAPALVNDRLVAAYKTLGIDEIVMGVDAFTDGSIRALKTNFNQLVQKGEAARPVYTFADIQAVTRALESAGLDSRCFLLVYNPFAADADRVATFYNLLHLALEVPGFIIDSSSSDRVNELKPFPGAPLTVLAESVPGLVQGERFHYRTPLGRLEELFDLEMFGQRRRTADSMDTFHARARQARLRLAARLADADTSGLPAEAHHEVSEARRRFVADEARLAPAFSGRDGAAVERDIARLAALAAARCSEGDGPPKDGHERLYRALRTFTATRRRAGVPFLRRPPEPAE